MQIIHINQLKRKIMMLKEMNAKERHELLQTPLADTYVNSLSASEKLYCTSYIVQVYSKLNPNNRITFIVDPLLVSLTAFQEYMQNLLNDNELIFVYDTAYQTFADRMPKLNSKKN